MSKGDENKDDKNLKVYEEYLVRRELDKLYNKKVINDVMSGRL